MIAGMAKARSALRLGGVTVALLVAILVGAKEAEAKPPPAATPAAASEAGEGQVDTQALAAALLGEVNRLRANPSAYADELAAVRKTFKGEVFRSTAGRLIQTREGPSAFDEAIAELRGTGKMRPVQAFPPAALAALAHAQELGASNHRGHAGKNGSRPLDRVLGHTRDPVRSVAEVISYGAVSPQEIVQSFLVDDGVDDRGHRKALLDPTLRFAGAGCARHQLDPVCVIDLVEPTRDKPQPR